MEKFKKFNLFWFVILLLLVAGTVLRFVFFSYFRPLWNDECALALNIVNSWDYFSPLDYGQAAPQLFMYLSKIFYQFFPDKTFALKFLPFCSAILSLFIFCVLALKLLCKKISVITAVALFSLCYPLCRYAQEFKQYSTDVLCFLIILLSWFYIDKIVTGGRKQRALYTLGCSVLIWLSFSSVFALCSLFIALLVFHREYLKNLLLPLSIVALNTALFAACNFHLNTSASLHSYWADGFINKGMLKFIELFIKNTSYIFNTGLPLFFIVLSITLIFVKGYKKQENVLIIIPFFLILILSYFEIYPFSTRVILFLIPVFILLLAKFIDFVSFKHCVINNIIASILFVMLVFPEGIASLKNIVYKNYEEENIIVPLQVAIETSNPEDIIYISDGSEIIWEYYRRFFDISNPVVVESVRYSDEHAYIDKLNQLPTGKTYYWILAHHPEKFERLKTVYMWAKDKQNFQIYADKKGNAVIKFTI